MDKTTVFGTVDGGSIPSGGTTKENSTDRGSLPAMLRITKQAGIPSGGTKNNLYIEGYFLFKKHLTIPHNPLTIHTHFNYKLCVC